MKTTILFTHCPPDVERIGRRTAPELLIVILLCGFATAAIAQLPAPRPRQPPGANYASNLVTIAEAQDQALDQARQVMATADNPHLHDAVEAAIRDMTRSKERLAEAKDDPAKLSAALSAQQSAYEALLKLIPREFRVARGQNNARNGSAGQPGSRELSQLEMTSEENRYETERQASADATPRQREQSATADRLKQLAQRQQDLNDRLRELQTALQEARTDAQREDVQHQLKRLREEQRNMLTDLDELRQKIDQSQDPNSMSQARQELDRARSDMERASRELENDAVSQALAAGTRAQQGLRDVHEDLRRQSSSQFAAQLRELRNQARELSRQEDQLASKLEALGDQDHKTLDDSAGRQEALRQMATQQAALTNLLAAMRAVTEQSESTEPLLSRQLYDALRRADQAHADNLFDTSSQLLERGFLPQAAQAEHSASRAVDQLRKDVEQAAESVLGNEAEALRFARNQLDTLARQVERELAGTNDVSAVAGSSVNATNPGAATREQPVESESRNPQTASAEASGRPGDRSRLEELARQLGPTAAGGIDDSGPITGTAYGPWLDRMRDVEEVLDSPSWRGQLAGVRERVAALRAEFRRSGRVPDGETIRGQILEPMTEVRGWLQEELARTEDANSLVPLDRDPVPDNYTELVRRYYERLGNAR